MARCTIDLSAFDSRFCNDATGATAYPPAGLLQVVLCAYAHGIVSSRGIERASQEQVTFIALSGDTAPHFTTIAHFVSTLGEEIAHVFAAVAESRRYFAESASTCCFASCVSRPSRAPFV